MRKIFLLIAVVLVQSPLFAQLPAYLPPGVIAWFPFTGNAIDSSMHGHDGTIHGTTNAVGRYGVPNTALYFNGISDFIYVPPGTPGYDVSTDITASLTISAWVKSQNYSFTSQEQIYWRGDALPAHDPHMLYFIGGEVKIRRDVDPGTISNEVGTSVGALDTNYHMMTGTYDSITSVMNVYLDGVLMNTATLPGLETYPTSTMYNYIGAVDGGTWQFFYGTMDELAIWNRALTPCEVMDLYHSVPNIITTQPVNDTVLPAGTATFTVHDVVPSSTYQWQENSGLGFVNLTATAPYSGVFTPTLTISPVTLAMSGNQYRCVPASGTCLTDTSGAAKLIVRTSTATCIGIPDYSIQITPNPNKGSFNITGSFGADPQVVLEITNPLGQVVYTEKIAPQNGHINNTIMLPDNVANGLYFLKIHSLGANRVLPFVVRK
jgi:Concanavalin A-like lectin/glucanases superfamily/Secretion system C-terminal sorting domain